MDNYVIINNNIIIKLFINTPYTNNLRIILLTENLSYFCIENSLHKSI